MRRTWLVVVAYWAVVGLIGFLAAEVTLWALLGLPVAMVALGAALAAAESEPREGTVLRDEELY